MGLKSKNYMPRCQNFGFENLAYQKSVSEIWYICQNGLFYVGIFSNSCSHENSRPKNKQKQIY